VLSLQEISDRFEIQDLIARYSQLLDRQSWDEMGALFTDDCILDYTATGAKAGTWPEQRDFIVDAFKGFKGTQHLMGLPIIRIDGDAATARTICFNPMIINDKKLFYVGLWYDDELLRTGSGWRFQRRTEELSYFDGL
jgi:hypothetical protein